MSSKAMAQQIDELQTENERAAIRRKADQKRQHPNPDAEKIAMLYEKYSLWNVDYSLEQRTKIRFGERDKATYEDEDPGIMEYLQFLVVGTALVVLFPLWIIPYIAYKAWEERRK